MKLRTKLMTEAPYSSKVQHIADYKNITTNKSTPKMKSATSGGGGSGMEERLARVESDVTHIQSDVTHIKTYGIGFSAFFILLIVGFSGWQSHKFDRVEDKFDRVEDKLDVFDERLDRLEVSMGKVEVKLDNVEARLGGIEVKLNSVETILIDIRDNLSKEAK